MYIMIDKIKLRKGEQIKPVHGFESRFLITNFGRLFSINGKYKDVKEIGTAIDNVGYYCCMLRNKNILKRCRVHQLVASHFIDKPENAECVNHKDGNKLNNHVDNLEWTTLAENIKHAIENKLHDLKGEKHPQVKLKETDVIEIYRLHELGLSHQQICDKIGIVKRRHVTDIINGKCWGWLKEKYQSSGISSSLI